MSVRVRFAPAPSGELHVGNVHTALFNWLFARHHGGSFVLRVEDTDRERARPEYVETIYRDLSWLGMDWDEGPDVGGAFGPYLVSQRADRHRQVLAGLLDSGKAYRCYCTAGELAARGADRHYDGHCRDAPVRDEAFTVRLRMPAGEVVFHDEILGDVKTPADQVSDPRIARSDGSPVYLLAVVCDDADMGITHVIRGADIISATATHVALFEALGAPVPKFAHLGVLLDPSGRKLGKRHGAVNAESFRLEGYLPEAIVNYLALLGWSSPSLEEILDVERIVGEFDLDRVNPANCVFDQTKLRWLNQQHLMRLDPSEVERRVAELFSCVPRQMLHEVCRRELVQSRVEVLSEIPEAIAYLHSAPSPAPSEAPEVVAACVQVLEALPVWTAEYIKEAVFAAGAALGLNRRKTTKPLYVAVSGSPVSLPLFDSMEILGRSETLRRLRATL